MKKLHRDIIRSHANRVRLLGKDIKGFGVNQGYSKNDRKTITNNNPGYLPLVLKDKISKDRDQSLAKVYRDIRRSVTERHEQRLYGNFFDLKNTSNH